MPPRIPLSDRQREAIRTLDWLYSDDESDRRSGRSFVLALSYIRRLVRGGRIRWINVEDHWDSRECRYIVLDYISRIAHDLGLRVQIDRTRSRVALEGRAERRYADTWDLSYDTSVPDLVTPIKFEILKSRKPRRLTLWDTLKSDDLA
jgi:hypothetical protein